MNKPMNEAWAGKISVVESIRGGMSDEAKSTLSCILENTSRTVADFKTLRGSTNESCNCAHGLGCNTPASQFANIDWFPEHAIDMVSAIYASQVMDDLVSVQPIDSPIGMVRFIQYLYGRDRGNAARDGVAIDEWGAMVGVDQGRFVTCEKIKGEQITAATDDSTTSTYTINLQCLPVKEDSNLEFETESNGTYRAIPSGTGWKLVNSSDVEVANAEITLTADTGALTVKVPVATPDFTSINYFQDLAHCPTDSMNLVLKLRTEVVKAVPHKIRANFAFDASYALSKAHGINVEEALVNACTAEIRQERDNAIINILMKQAAGHSKWSTKITSYISQAEHNQSFITELFDCATLINQKIKRGFGNWVVVGRRAYSIIKSATNRFTPAGGGLPKSGAFVAGMIDDELKVIYSPYMAEDAYLVGYKGTDPGDAGFVVADFLPVTKTDLVMLDDFVGRQGLVSYYGTKMLNPDMYVAGEITDDPLT